MLRVTNLNSKFQKRTIRPLFIYGASLYPEAKFVDFNKLGTTVVKPGQIATALSSDWVTLANDGEPPYGLFTNFINGDLDELGGGTEVGVWTSGDFEILPEVIAGRTAVVWNKFDIGDPVYANDLGYISLFDGYPIGELTSINFGSDGGFRSLWIKLDIKIDPYWEGYRGNYSNESLWNDPSFNMGEMDRLGDAGLYETP